MLLWLMNLGFAGGAVAFTGPLVVAAYDTHIAGAVASEVHIAGAIASDTFTAGSEASEVQP